MRKLRLRNIKLLAQSQVSLTSEPISLPYFIYATKICDVCKYFIIAVNGKCPDFPVRSGSVLKLNLILKVCGCSRIGNLEENEISCFNPEVGDFQTNSSRKLLF